MGCLIQGAECNGSICGIEQTIESRSAGMHPICQGSFGKPSLSHGLLYLKFGKRRLQWDGVNNLFKIRDSLMAG